MRPSTTARRYAEAAFDVATEDGDVAAWLRDLDRASEMMQQSEVAGFFKDPNVAEGNKVEAVDRTFRDVNPHVRNLLRMLTVLNRLNLLPGIVTELRDLDRAARGVVEAFVTVARPITDTESADIAQRLGKATGKTIEIHVQVDASILGGIVVRLGDRLIDASVKGRLDRLRSDLAG